MTKRQLAKLPPHLARVARELTHGWVFGWQVKRALNFSGVQQSESATTARIRELRQYGIEVQRQRPAQGGAHQYRIAPTKRKGC